MSTEQFSFFPLFAFILFFLPAARPQCHLPCQRGLCHQGARTPECQERQQEALNQGHSSMGTKTVRSPDAWTEQIPSVFEPSECNPSPKVPTEGIGRRKTHDMICCAGQIDEKGLYVQGQGLLSPPRQCEGTRPSVYQLCSQCANSYITMTTLVWGWQWIKHIFGILKRLASLDSTIDPGIQHCSKWAINQQRWLPLSNWEYAVTMQPDKNAWLF